MEEIFQRFAGAVAIGVEAAAALFIAIGAVEALFLVLRRYNPHARASVLGRKEIWVRFAVWLLLALEFELAADVLQTAISPTWDDVGKLAAIAAIRTVLKLLSRTGHRESSPGSNQTRPRREPRLCGPNTISDERSVNDVERGFQASFCEDPRGGSRRQQPLFFSTGTTPVMAQEPAPAPQAPPPPATEILKRGELFGDWGGARTKMGEKGTKIDASFTQFFDWVPVGDDDRGFDYGGKVDVKVQSNLSKYLWEGFSATGHFEMRYGDVPLLSGGTLIPTIQRSSSRNSSGTHAHGQQPLRHAGVREQVRAAVRPLQLSRFLYDVHPFTGGEGIDRFMNLSLVAPPVSARTVPPSGEGVMFSVLKGAAPMVTVGLIESTEHGFFENGATFMWNVALPVKLSKTLPGGISVGGEVGSSRAPRSISRPGSSSRRSTSRSSSSRARGRST